MPQHTPDSWLRYSKFSARSTGWLAWATHRTLLNSSHVLLWYTWSAGTFAFTQTAYLLKLVISTTNTLPRWRLNVETKTKRKPHSSRRLSFNPLNAELNPIFHLLALLGGATIVVVSRLRVNELTNAKVLVVHSSHLLSTDAAARLCVRRAL